MSLTTTPTFEHNPAAWFVDTIYQAQRRGWREVCYIIGDPDDPDNSTFHQEWYVLFQRDQMLARIAELQALGYNVYVGASTYSKPKWAKQLAYPSRAIVIDDAPAGAYSFTVQTGPTTQHAWLITEQPLDVTGRERIARNAAYDTGGDRGGWDCTQLVRVPGGLNTKAKYGTPFRVQLHAGTGKAYSVDELLQRWPEAPHYTGGDGALNWPEAEACLSNFDSFLGPDKLPYRLSKTSQSYRILSGELPVRNRSDARYIVAKGCVLHRMPDAEIAAILVRLCDYGHSKENGSAWLYQDVERIIDKARTAVNQKRAQEGPCRHGTLQPNSLPPLNR